MADLSLNFPNTKGASRYVGTLCNLLLVLYALYVFAVRMLSGWQMALAVVGEFCALHDRSLNPDLHFLAAAPVFAHAATEPIDLLQMYVRVGLFAQARSQAICAAFSDLLHQFVIISMYT